MSRSLWGRWNQSLWGRLEPITVGQTEPINVGQTEPTTAKQTVFFEQSEQVTMRDTRRDNTSMIYVGRIM